METFDKYTITINHVEEHNATKVSESVFIPDDVIDWKDDEKIVSLTVRFVKLLSLLFKNFPFDKVIESVQEVLLVIKEDTEEWRDSITS